MKLRKDIPDKILVDREDLEILVETAITTWNLDKLDYIQLRQVRRKLSRMLHTRRDRL